MNRQTDRPVDLPTTQQLANERRRLRYKSRYNRTLRSTVAILLVGAVILLYTLVVLPLWFRYPNPVIFIPIDFAMTALYLLYINCATGGHWFLSFALPVTAAAGLILTAAVTLLKYLRKGYLFIFGGTIILSGAYTVLVEFLLNLNFHVHDEFIWSFYPFSVSFILGVMLIVIGICRPLRESLHKKFFL